jgi:hypothetical protein
VPPGCAWTALFVAKGDGLAVSWDQLDDLLKSMELKRAGKKGFPRDAGTNSAGTG